MSGQRFYIRNSSNCGVDIGVPGASFVRLSALRTSAAAAQSLNSALHSASFPVAKKRWCPSSDVNVAI